MRRRKQEKQVVEKPFYALTEKMVHSKAWSKLDTYAIAACIHIAIKHKGNNKRDLSFTYSEAKRLMSEHRFKKSIDMLVEFGFIDIVRSGGVWRKCNIYGLSERWRLYGAENFIKGKRTVVAPDFDPLALSVK